jgi:putative serine protease PepD
MEDGTPVEQLPPAWWRRARRRFTVALVVGALAAGALAGAVAGHLTAGDGSSGETSSGPTTSIIAPTSTTTATTATTVGATDGSDPLSTLPGLVVTISPSVVAIDVVGSVETPWGGIYLESWSGSGFVYRADGLVATNAHVVDGADQVTVTFSDGSTASATVVGSDAVLDLALIHVPRLELVPLPLGEHLTVHVGDFVIAAGNALALEGAPTITVGIVSGLHRDIELSDGSSMTDVIQTDAAISSGNSGGPLLSATGVVIGINTAAATSDGTTTAANVGFAVPITVAAPYFAQLAARVQP